MTERARKTARMPDGYTRLGKKIEKKTDPFPYLLGVMFVVGGFIVAKVVL